MRWPIKPNRGYTRMFALVPVQTIEGCWIWLEPYYGRFDGMCIERWTDPQSHWLTCDSDGSGEAGQTAKQAGPKATARADRHRPNTTANSIGEGAE